MSYCASHLQDLNPCSLLQLEGHNHGLELLALHPAEISRDSSRRQCQEPSQFPEAQHCPGRGSWGGCGSSRDWHTSHGVHTGSWVVGVQLVMRVMP